MKVNRLKISLPTFSVRAGCKSRINNVSIILHCTSDRPVAKCRSGPILSYGLSGSYSLLRQTIRAFFIVNDVKVRSYTTHTRGKNKKPIENNCNRNNRQ